MANIKNLTLLHSNDMHGDFLAEEIDKQLLGGVSMLSGYVNKVRNEEDNSLYVIAGDMFRGSVIDSEFKGLSTIEIMNMIAPDVATLGNHEIDYGLAHLIFLEKCANFPIINANIYIKSNMTRLFEPYRIIEIDGMKIMFIGLLTEEIMDYAKQDDILGSFVDIEEAAEAVGKICNNYKTIDIDLTVLLTHIGFEQDKKLAELLDPNWGVDIIVGGHSHTVLDEPELVNDILIVQAGTGTDMIGRFDLKIDTDTNRVDSYEWKLVPIDSSYCPVNEDLKHTIEKYKEITDKKFGRILTHLPHQLTHPVRYRETDMGNLFADIFQESLGLDIMFLGSGSIRTNSLGPTVTFGDLAEAFPYDDWIMSVYANGDQLKRMVKHLLRDDAYLNETEFYQFSKGLFVTYSYPEKEIVELTLNGEPLDDEKVYSVGIQRFHLNNFDRFFGIPMEEVEQNEKQKIASTTCLQILDEYLTVHNRISSKVEGRITVLGLE